MIAAVVMDLDGTLIESDELGADDPRQVRVVDGAEAMVRALAGYVPVAVATTAPARYVAALTDLLPELFEQVSSIVVGDPVEGSMSAELLEISLESLGMAPGNVVALLNSVDGLMEARALGMRAMALPDPRRPLPWQLAAAGIPISPTPHHAAVSLLRAFRTEGVIPLRWKLIRQLLPV
ncbi:hypothetical protein [Nocardia seriolae]|uniref:Uncharacterized protein n=1 Tax=Nocardia seriolae TaxID=37332 RepID=A0A0B8NMX5_9NOCA|nr:hypothetical protein [Nocardia seriolae]APA97344.1 hypothetical protein NS506_03291 [Nocardia seriolae]MTJ62256.1 hypothetical protein [Nocardia seriolae]MTJ75778.1 hypothetical protein [Nocardia seriolae]MTJ87163.1 hypothetical protein [Nocardia seriolae]MTK31157.1 hypothetical protein [Nocardia seriolae]